jgi:hypothetical protein
MNRTIFRHRRLAPPVFLQAIMVSVLCTALCFSAFATTAPADSTAPAEEDEGYRIDQPGTITFTVGVKISGKVEKPQVMIFLPKEKTQYRDEVLSRSFVEELSQPLPFTPLE